MGGNAATLDKLSYKIVYALFTAICLLPIVIFWLLSINNHPAIGQVVLCSLGVPVIFTVISWYGIRHFTLGIATQIVEASVLIGCGTGVMFAAPFQRLPGEVLAAMTLSILWLSQATFRYGYIQNIHNPVWETANQMLPAFFFIAAALWLGWRLRILSS
jgi:hypothetical protein